MIKEVLRKSSPGESVVDRVDAEVKMCSQVHQFLQNGGRVIGVERPGMFNDLVELEQLVIGSPPRHDRLDDIGWASGDV